MGLGGEGDGAFGEPVLEDGHAADVGEGLLGLVVLEQAALADDLLFLGEHLGDVVAAEAAVLDDDLGEDVFGFAHGEAEGGLEQAFTADGVQFDLDLFQLLDVLDDEVELVAEVVLGGEGEVEDGDFLFQFGGDFEQGRDEEDGLVGVLEVEGDFLESADDGEVVSAEEGVEILEDEDGGFDEVDDLVEGVEGVLAGGVAGFLGLDGGTGGDDAGAVAPLEDLLLAFSGDIADEGEHAGLLAGDQVEDGVAGADEGFQFGGEAHGLGHGEEDGDGGVWRPARAAMEGSAGLRVARMAASSGERLRA